MPKVYETIRDEYIKKGYSMDKAQSIAAATYNNLRKKDPSMEPLSNKPEGDKKKKKHKTGMSKGIGVSSKMK